MVQIQSLAWECPYASGSAKIRVCVRVCVCKQYIKINILHTFQEDFCNESSMTLDTINMLMPPNFKSLALYFDTI